MRNEMPATTNIINNNLTRLTHSVLEDIWSAIHHFVANVATAQTAKHCKKAF